MINGKTYSGARKGSKSAGMIFFNDEGDECGELGMHRLFVGNNAALLVDQKNQAHLQFLDEGGKVV